MRADGTHVRQIPGTGHYEGLGIARYSPDGSHLAFGASTEQGSAAFTIRLDGTHTRRVTPWAFDGGAYDWSPDGRWLLVESHADGSWQRNVFLVHPNGTDLHAVTHTYTGGASNWGGLAFSPDGTMIAAAHTGVGNVNPDIWVMHSMARAFATHQFVDLRQRPGLGIALGLSAGPSRQNEETQWTMPS